MFVSRICAFLLMALSFLSCCGQELPLPRKLASKAVHYMKTKQLDAFSCGYNCLFNAANFQQKCSFQNKAYKYETFEDKVLPYVQNKRLDPLQASTNTDIQHLARNILKLMPTYDLYRGKKTKQVEFLISESVRISYPAGSSQAEINRRMDAAVLQKQKGTIESIKKYLTKNPVTVIHFICYVKSQGVDHAVLVSLYQNATGRGLYLFDNMNAPVNESSDVVQYIEYLCKTFSVSSRASFVGPELPRRWPYLDSDREYANPMYYPYSTEPAYEDDVFSYIENVCKNLSISPAKRFVATRRSSRNNRYKKNRTIKRYLR